MERMSQHIKPQLLESLFEVGMLAERHLQTLCERHEITVSQYRVLRTIERRGALQPKQLVDHQNISAPAISTIVESLVQSNLLKRSDHASDRRCHILELTKEGAVRAESITSALKEISEKLTSSLSDSERSTLDTLLQQIVNPA